MQSYNNNEGSGEYKQTLPYPCYLPVVARVIMTSHTWQTDQAQTVLSSSHALLYIPSFPSKCLRPPTWCGSGMYPSGTSLSRKRAESVSESLSMTPTISLRSFWTCASLSWSIFFSLDFEPPLLNCKRSRKGEEADLYKFINYCLHLHPQLMFLSYHLHVY